MVALAANASAIAMACPFPADGDGDGNGNGEPPNAPTAVLLCRENSHPFQKRTLLLHQPVKIGRTVAKIKADVNNAIFDCKVLSRHHASLWYEGGRFYLADTKSSNGTFVNSYRLSEGNKESGPYEVSSGDVVQFGVDVMENSGSVTHGCIVATLKLYYPDGKEAKASPSYSLHGPIDDVNILNKIVQEAIEQEYVLEEKLNSLRQAVESCRDAADTSWRTQVCVDHLLCRVNFLEKRLAATNHTASQTELQKLLDEKYKYEVSAKESLRKMHDEKVKLKDEVQSLKYSLCSSKDECIALRNSTERTHEENQKLNIKCSSLEQQLKIIQKSLSTAESKLAEEEKRHTKELAADAEKQIIQLKNDKSLTQTCDILDNGKNEIIMDNKKCDDQDYKDDTSLSESVQNLPDYIKAILLDHMLEMVNENSNCIEKTREVLYEEELKKQIKKACEQYSHVKEEGPAKKTIFLQEELSNAMRKIASLKNEQTTMQFKLDDFYYNTMELKQDKERLVSEKTLLENELSEKAELCKTLEIHLTQWSEKEKSNEVTHAKYKEVALELQNQLCKAFESEANSCKEIKELNSKIQELQTQLEKCTHVSELSLLQSDFESLKKQLAVKENEADELKKQVSILKEIQTTLEEKLCKTISEQNHTQLDHSNENRKIDNCEDSVITDNYLVSSTLSAVNLVWNREQNSFLSNDGTVIPSISVDLKRLSELEEELICTKEKWANVNEERLQVACELKNMTEKYNRLANRSIINLLMYIVPIVAVFYYFITMHQSIS